MRIVGITGSSGSGKTTLIQRILPLLIARGLRVSTIKRAHHEIDIDRPGKDSWLHREAGATEVMLSSGRRFALMRELRGEAEPSIPALLSRMEDVDLVLIEGAKSEAHPKIEIFRPTLGLPPLYPDDPAILALAAPAPLPTAPIPVFDLDDDTIMADAVLGCAQDPRTIAWKDRPA